VFCQAGAIHVPASYRRILTYAEDSVRQVIAPTSGRVFHPKIWAVRFIDAAGRFRHRLLCLSRNLTFDRSWDTVLRLDEADDTGTDAAGGAPDCLPLAQFVAALPSLCVGPLEPARASGIDSLADSLRHARFVLPAGTDDLRFLPLGLGSTPAGPFPARTDQLLAVSAFLDTTTVTRLAGSADSVILLSRQESLDKIGSDASLQSTQLFTLQRSAEVEVGDDVASPARLLNEASDTPEGLHAKTFIADVGARAVVVTGSANATTAGFGGNVEFDVVMEGARKECGVAATWEGSGARLPGWPGSANSTRPVSCPTTKPTPPPGNGRSTSSTRNSQRCRCNCRWRLSAKAATRSP
jgi:hypothetical protein